MNTAAFSGLTVHPALAPLPITPYLEEICETLKKSHSRFLVLTAQTAAGKSTAVPVALLQAFSGKILMLEPRRLAAVAIANRVAELLDEKAGETAGYRLHLENRIGKNTRLEVMTEAILTRQLQGDPSLEGVSVVVLDEFHERSVYSDLALAFLKEAMLLRDDLYVIVMSATINATAVAAYLGNAPVLEISGRQFPVEIEYAPNCTPAEAVLRCLDEYTDNTAARNAGGSAGSILVFLPGLGDIRRTKEALSFSLGSRLDADGDLELLILHSSVPLSEQRKVLLSQSDACSGSHGSEPATARRRIILSSAIAETSLTVPDVTIVIDSGLARINRMNVALGMEKLVTERESLFSANQRAGRAGRVAAGRCIRLWNQFDTRTMVEQMEPEILRTDLVPLVLECAAWGASAPEKIDWLSAPSRPAWKAAQALLVELGCLSAGGDSPTDAMSLTEIPLTEVRITSKGKQALQMGLHPRLACVVLSGADRGVLNQAVHCVLRFSNYAESSPRLQDTFCQDLVRRAERCGASGTASGTMTDGELLLAGFPDRIGRRTDIAAVGATNSIFSATGAGGANGAGREAGAGFDARRDTAEYQFPGGRKARLMGVKNPPRYLVAPEADAGTTTARIYSFEPLPDNVALSWLGARVTVRTETVFADDSATGKNARLIKTEYTAYGALVLKERALQASTEDYSAAVCAAVQKHGLEWLPLSTESKSLLLRARFYAEHATAHAATQASAVPASAAQMLAEKLHSLTGGAQEWLVPFLAGGSRSLTEQTVYSALSWYLGAAEIDRAVPVQLTLANGKKRHLVYEDNGKGVQPVLEVIIQQIFGCFETPRVLGVPVLLKLLSPARRPLQITEDLAGFWNGSWIEICKEMKGRYPKHNWDYRVAESE